MTRTLPDSGEPLSTHYARRIADGSVRDDAAQRRALDALEHLRRDLFTAPPPARRLRAPSRTGSGGIYLWGDVGRGKTMLMDLFFENAGADRKLRIHFDAFMRNLHAAVHRARTDGRADPLGASLSAMTDGLRLLALDELQVRDIADSTILRRVFGHLFARGVKVVTTSNLPPGDLYGEGQKRELFQPLIDLLSSRLAVHHLSGPEDHRLAAVPLANRYLYPDDDGATATLDGIWGDLTRDQAGPMTLHVLGRQFVLPAYHERMARLSFADACTKPRSTADYLALAGAVDLLVLDHVPRLSAVAHDVARRFIQLVDALYDAGTLLVVSAQAEPEHLYPGGEGALAFRRLTSRLREMQSWDGKARMATAHGKNCKDMP